MLRLCPPVAFSPKHPAQAVAIRGIVDALKVCIAGILGAIFVQIPGGPSIFPPLFLPSLNHFALLLIVILAPTPKQLLRCPIRSPMPSFRF